MSRSPVTGYAPCRKETRSSSKLVRDRKALRRPTAQRRADEAVGNYLAGRERPPAGNFYSTSIRARPHCVNGAYSISRALLDKLSDDWVLRRKCRHLPPTPLARRDRPRCRVLSRKAYQWNCSTFALPRRFPRPPHRQRSEERRVGKECRSRWSPY